MRFSFLGESRWRVRGCRPFLFLSYLVVALMENPGVLRIDLAPSRQTRVRSSRDRPCQIFPKRKFLVERRPETAHVLRCVRLTCASLVTSFASFSHQASPTGLPCTPSYLNNSEPSPCVGHCVGLICGVWTDSRERYKGTTWSRPFGENEECEAARAGTGSASEPRSVTRSRNAAL